MDKKRLNELLDEIEESLGHYAGTGGPAPPYMKTDDEAIRKSVAEIRAGVKSVATEPIFVTAEGKREKYNPAESSIPSTMWEHLH